MFILIDIYFRICQSYIKTKDNPFIGLDAGDRIALDYKFKRSGAPPCQYDKEDRRFVMRGKYKR